MHDVSERDGNRRIEWGGTSDDYAKWRPDYPAEFYTRIRALGIGHPGQSILDLGTGVGFLARNFAAAGASVVGIDISPGQIDVARRCAREEKLDIDFRVGPVEENGLPDASFDVISAGQAWLYFDHATMIGEVKRLLKPTGVLMTCHFSWLPRLDETAQASEQLVLKFNPDWSAADWSGRIPAMPDWAVKDFDLVGMFQFDLPIAFSRERWRGRMRACRGVAATLTPSEVDAFDAEHQRLLEQIVNEDFTILHRVDAHILRPIRTSN